MNRRWLLYSGVLLLFSWFLLSGIDQFPYPASGEYSDFTITHFPNLVYTQNSLKEWGQVPLWNTAILSGNPYAADPLSSLWYPPYWLAVALPAPFGLNFLTIIHVAAGGLGLALLAEALGFRQLAAYTAGVVFVLMPKLYAHLGAGHITMIWAVSLTPWLLYLEHRSSQVSNSIFSRVLPALAAGWILLADVRWGLWSWLLWWTFAYSQARGTGAWVKTKPVNVFVRIAWQKAQQSITAILIASPLLLPLIQFIGLSTRNSIKTTDSLYLSLPPASLFGLVYPNFGGSAEWMTYFGVVPIVLFLVVLACKRNRSKMSFWIIWFFVALVVSLGDNLPGAELVARLPVFSLLRVPPRCLFIAGICLSVITASGLQLLSGDLEGKEKKVIRLVIAGFIALSVGIGLLFGMNAEKPVGFIWGAAISALVGSAILFMTYKRITIRAVFAILLALLIVDLGFTSHSMIQFENEPKTYAEKIEISKTIIAEDENQGRVYSPSYSVPQEMAALNDIRLADGIAPLQLASYSAYMAEATGVKTSGYSVTVPDFVTGNPRLDNKDALLDVEKLGWLNVAHIVAAFSLESAGIELVKELDGVYIYRNTAVMPAAWVQEGTELNAAINFQPAQIIQYSPNKVIIQAEGAGILVLTDPNYPGWKAEVDGEKTKILDIGGLLRGVEISAGSHEVEYSFRPVLLYAGFACQIVVLIGILLSIIAKRRITV